MLPFIYKYGSVYTRSIIVCLVRSLSAQRSTLSPGPPLGCVSNHLGCSHFEVVYTYTEFKNTIYYPAQQSMVSNTISSIWFTSCSSKCPSSITANAVGSANFHFRKKCVCDMHHEHIMTGIELPSLRKRSQAPQLSSPRVAKDSIRRNLVASRGSPFALKWLARAVPQAKLKT